MKKSFLTLMATVAVLSSSPLLAMQIEENIEVNNQKSPVHQLPIALNQEVANELNKNKSIRTSAGKFEVNPLDDRKILFLSRDKEKCTLIPSFLFNENKKLLLQRIMENDTINSIILEKSEELEVIKPNVPILKFEEIKIEDNRKSIEIIEEVKKPIQIPQFLDPYTFKQILDDGYLNTTEGMFKFSGNNKFLAESIYTIYDSLMSDSSIRFDNQLVFQFYTLGIDMPNPNWHPEFIGQEKNPLWNPNEPEFVYIPGKQHSFALEN